MLDLWVDIDQLFATTLWMSYCWPKSVDAGLFFYLLVVGVAVTYSQLPRSGLGVG